MGLRDTARKNDVARDLIGLEAQATSAISQLLAIKNNLLSMKQAANDEDIFSEEEEAEIQAVITALAERVQQEILGG